MNFMEREKISSSEKPGKVYENVKQLSGDIQAFREKIEKKSVIGLTEPPI